jgi:hypothetical protein
MLYKKLAAFSVCLFVACIVCGPAFAGNATPPSPVGAWQFTLAQGGSPASSSVAGLITFTSDATVVEDDVSEIAVAPVTTTSVAPATGGQGIWQPSPVFGDLFVQFISLVANPKATLRARRIVTMTIALNSTHDKFRGGYSSEVVDSGGRVLSTGSGTVTGTLIPHPALP